MPQLQQGDRIVWDSGYPRETHCCLAQGERKTEREEVADQAQEGRTDMAALGNLGQASMKTCS